VQPGVVLTLPSAPFSQGTGVGLVAVVLPISGSESATEKAIVFFDDERFVVGRPEQMQEMAEARAERLAEHPEAALVLQADRDVPHGTIVELIDVAAGVGVRHVNVAVRPE
jgi:biopolymer transport protein ExbD